MLDGFAIFLCYIYIYILELIIYMCMSETITFPILMLAVIFLEIKHVETLLIGVLGH